MAKAYRQNGEVDVAFPEPVLLSASTDPVMHICGFQPLAELDFRLRTEFWNRSANALRSCAHWFFVRPDDEVDVNQFII